MTTPAQRGYHFPAEWEKHDAILLAWPHDPTTFPDIPKAELAYVSIISAIHKSEEVLLLVKSHAMRDRVKGYLLDVGVDIKRVHPIIHDYADVWARDYGPTFVVNRQKKKVGMVKWTFNAWGNKYETLLKDDDVPLFLNRRFFLDYFPAGIVAEGGALDTNGKGTLLTTKECLLNPNRNMGRGQKEIESILKSYLGVKTIIWLNKGLEGDDTDAHIDNLARFVDETTVLCSFDDDESSPNHANLAENYKLLLAAKDQDGNPLKVEKLPVPVVKVDGRRLPASYANFYIGNTVVLVPQFGHANDAKALSIIGAHLPTRQVVGIDCSELVRGNGTLHCISQQKPSP